MAQKTAVTGAEATKRFFKLLGVPQRSTECDGSVPLYLGDPTSIKNATVEPRPVTGKTELFELDVFDALNEEPFTLETFESLLLLHAEKGKDFIVARVTTVDPRDASRFYYNYYAAHHINKVLFRTQPERGLMHRMRAKNPLNNMTIVGDVYYYVVRAVNVDLAALRKFEDSDGEAAFAGRNSVVSLEVDTSRPYVQAKFPRRHSRLLSPECYIFNSSQTPAAISPDGRSLPEPTSPTRRPPFGVAAMLGLPRGRSSWSGRINTSLSQGASPQSPRLVLMMKPEALTESDRQSTRHVAMNEDDHAAEKATNDQLHSLLVVGPNTCASPYESETSQNTLLPLPTTVHPHSEMVIVTSPTVAGELTTGLSPQITIPALVTGNMAEPASPGQLHWAAWSSETRPGSIHDWLRAHASPVDRANAKSNDATFRLSTLGRTFSHAHARERRQQQEVTGGKGLQPELVSAEQSTADLDLYLYEATYLASDDDFLMKPAVRAYFNKNALEREDAVLFSIMGTATANVPIVAPNAQQHPALPNFMYATVDPDGATASDSSGTLRGPSATGQRVRALVQSIRQDAAFRGRRALHRVKQRRFLLLLGLYVVFALLLLVLTDFRAIGWVAIVLGLCVILYLVL